MTAIPKTMMPAITLKRNDKSSNSIHQAKTVCTYPFQGNRDQEEQLDRQVATILDSAKALYATTSVAAPKALEKSDRKKPNRNSALKLKKRTLRKIRVIVTKVIQMLNACIGRQ